MTSSSPGPRKPLLAGGCSNSLPHRVVYSLRSTQRRVGLRLPSLTQHVGREPVCQAPSHPPNPPMIAYAQGDRGIAYRLLRPVQALPSSPCRVYFNTFLHNQPQPPLLGPRDFYPDTMRPELVSCVGVTARTRCLSNYRPSPLPDVSRGSATPGNPVDLKTLSAEHVTWIFIKPPLLGALFWDRTSLAVPVKVMLSPRTLNPRLVGCREHSDLGPPTLARSRTLARVSHPVELC